MVERIVRYDDFDNEQIAAERITIGIDGGTWEVDLTAANAAELRAAFARYQKVGRKVTPARTSKQHRNAKPAKGSGAPVA